MGHRLTTEDDAESLNVAPDSNAVDSWNDTLVPTAKVYDAGTYPPYSLIDNVAACNPTLSTSLFL